ncbi:DNA replication protein DnaC [Lachnospiraceae bacterium PF1-21]|uniref:ATP-binding protein n=1 Tax=Ohessyouella blattaphilus TaxID=2949333 RepID=UPI00256D0E88|nr:ATP-binding protein [Lachnospiraceae bacterium OttesenSCG-928-J05]
MPLPTNLYDQIMRTYEQRQLDNHKRQMARYDEVYENIPAIKELDNRVSTLSIAKAKQMIEGDETVLGSIKEDLHLLFLEKRNLLKEHGYPADYLEPTYTCEDCQDTGYIDNKKCHCFKQQEIKLLYRQSNLGEILKDENFSTFDLNYYSDKDNHGGRSSRESAIIALNACQAFANNFMKTHENLLLFGDTGVGKTFLTHCVAKQAIADNRSVVYFTATDFFNTLADEAFRHKGNSENIENCDLLIIDDLGTEFANSFTNSQLFAFINDRILHRKATIISTNLSPGDLKTQYSERIFSRLSSAYTILRMTGEDIRIQKKLNK